MIPRIHNLFSEENPDQQVLCTAILFSIVVSIWWKGTPPTQFSDNPQIAGRWIWKLLKNLNTYSLATMGSKLWGLLAIFRSLCKKYSTRFESVFMKINFTCTKGDNSFVLSKYNNYIIIYILDDLPDSLVAIRWQFFFQPTEVYG